MATLHLLSHSPFDDGRFASCLALLGETDGLLLTGDATYALTAGTQPAAELERLSQQFQVFALEEDIQARALVSLPARVQLLDYPGFVEVSCRYARVNSWL